MCAPHYEHNCRIIEPRKCGKDRVRERPDQGNGDAIRDTGQKGGALDTLQLMGTKGGAIMNVEAE
jgi:hypothetical protein